MEINLPAKRIMMKSHKGIFPLHVWDIILSHAQIRVIRDISMTCKLLNTRYKNRYMSWLLLPVADKIYHAAADCDDYVLNVYRNRNFSEMEVHAGLEGAAWGGRLHVVKFFADRGAKYFNTPLQVASFRGHVDIVLFLIQKGANDFNYALNGAIEGGHLNLVIFFWQRGARPDDYAMSDAERNGHFHIMEFLRNVTFNES